MKVLIYKGRGLISRAIQWQTRSPWSHVALLLNGWRTVEAWHRGGVVISDTPGTLHAKGTEIAILRIEYDFNRIEAEDRLLAELGKDYDFHSVLRFISRRDAPADNKWFCSELVHYTLPFLLARVNSSHVSPRDIALSPYLKLEEVITVR